MADKGIILQLLWILRHIPVAWSHYLSEPDLLNNIPPLKNLHFLWLLWTYQSPEPLSLHTRLVKQYTTIRDLRSYFLHFLWLWTPTALKLLPEFNPGLLFKSLPNYQTLICPNLVYLFYLCCTFCGYCGHTSHLKPLRIVPYPTCYTIYHNYGR